MISAEYSYFLYSLIFLILWMLLWAVRKDYRDKLLLVSLAICFAGPISELWYLKDYWQRSTLTGFFISIEDFIFAFSVGGISFSIFKLAFNVTLSHHRHYNRRLWILWFSLSLILIFLLFFSTFLEFNSVVVSSICFFIIAIIVWYIRRDLIFPSVVSGLLCLIIFLIIYQIMFIVSPNFFNSWCNNCNPSGIKLYRINIEELVWDFSWGLVGGVLYEAISGRKLVSLSVKHNQYDGSMNKIIESYSRYDAYLNKVSSILFESEFGIFMSQSTKYILSLRVSRIVSFYFSKKIGCPLPSMYGVLFIAVIPSGVRDVHCIIAFPYESR